MSADVPSTPAPEDAGEAGGPAPWSPQKSDEVTLHEVASAREGTRYVLRHEGRGDYHDLAGGDADAWVWARLDGRTSVDELAQAYLEEHGTLHPDLAGLLERLGEAGLLADRPGVSARPELAGRRLTQVAWALVMVRIPIPWTEPLWRGVGKLAAPLFATPLLLAMALVGLIGLGAALGPWEALRGGAALLEWPTEAGGSLLLGLAVLLGLNAAVDLFEAVFQVALLARGKRSPGRIGLSFDLGVPGIYIETPESILLPLELRGWQLLAPLVAAGLAGAAATFGHAHLGASGGALALVLHKLAWVAWLRCLVHVNPLGPSPLHDALCAWWSQPNLRALVLRALRGGRREGDGDSEAISRREVVVLVTLGLAIVHLVLVARVGAHLLHRELLPAWDLAVANGDAGRTLVLGVLLLVFALPTLLALGGGLLMSLQAGLRALARSDLFPTPARLGAALGLGCLGLACLPGILAEPGRGFYLGVLSWLAPFLAGVTAVEGARLRRTSGAGWGALGGPFLALAALASTLLLVLLLVGPAGVGAQLAWGVLSVLMALAYAMWGLLEVVRNFRRGWSLPALAVAACFPLGAAPFLAETTTSMVGPFLLPASALLGLTSLFALGAFIRARGGARQTGLLLVAAGLAILSCGLGVWATGNLDALLAPQAGRLGGLLDQVLGAVHLPFLATALLASGAWMLRRARTVPVRRPDPDLALAANTAAERELAACAFLMQGLIVGLRDVFGPGAVAAAVVELEREVSVRLHPGSDPRVEDLVPAAEESPQARGFRHRLAAATLYRLLEERAGDQFAEHLLDRIVARLPARAHDAIALSGASLLPALGAVADVPQEARKALLAAAVPFADFGDDALEALAGRVGVRRFAPGEVIIEQGDVGDCFYVLANGVAQVVLETPDGEERNLATLGAGDPFGEAALLRHEPRSASVVADTSCLALTLERDVFASFMQEHKDLLAGVFARQEDLRLVREVPLFAGLPGEQVSALCRRLRPLEVEAEAAVITQGDPGDRFYLVREGELEVRHAAAEGAESQVVAELARGDYFGEIALLNDSPRTASVVATRRCELLTLERDDFHSLLGGRAGRSLARRSAERMQELSLSGQEALGHEAPQDGEPS
jgi:CRP-like cAMP-binding protein